MSRTRTPRWAQQEALLAAYGRLLHEQLLALATRWEPTHPEYAAGFRASAELTRLAHACLSETLLAGDRGGAPDGRRGAPPAELV